MQWKSFFAKKDCNGKREKAPKKEKSMKKKMRFFVLKVGSKRVEKFRITINY
ncbi:hypothetical protein ACFP3I_07625 [Chryseobacterium arachidis]|uniref:hypothetical protein n=1 Tax=Chryseobacterium arachidis TaxID=1416778 RepID=UPI00360EC35F